MDAKNKVERGDNLFHIFIDLKERAPVNIFDKYVSPYLSLEYDKNVKTRTQDAKDIAKKIKKLLKSKEKSFEELVVKVPGAGIVAHDIEIGLSSESKSVDILKGISILKQELSKIEGVLNIFDDADIGEKELKLRVNKYGQELGFSEAMLSNSLRVYYLNGEYGKLFNEQGLIKMRMKSNMKSNIDSIKNIEVQVPNSNKFVRVKDICNFVYVQSFVTLNKEDGIRLRDVFATLDKNKVTSSEVMQQLKPTFEKLKQKGYTLQIKGEEKENNKNKKEMMQAGIIALFLIFLTLVWLFDSLLKPLIVISTIPLVLLGVYVGHWIMGINLTMPGLIGIVGLSGVVVNDGLIMVDFIKKAKTTEELMQRAKTRLRPILLTSLTTVLGLFTLIFFASGQAMILQPMAISLGFGVAWATVLNLIYVPLVYALIYKIKAD